MISALRPVSPTLRPGCPAMAGTVSVPPGEAAFAHSASVVQDPRIIDIQHPFQAAH